MRVQWHGQSAFALSADGLDVVIDPFGPMEGAPVRFDYPPMDGVRADLVLVTHEHGDHNRVDVVAGDPLVLRAAAGRFPSPAGEVLGVASEHDDVAGTARGANVLFALQLDGLRVVHLGDLGQTALRAEQERALGRPDLLFVPVGGGPTMDAARAAEVVARLRPGWVVPMHYRTPAVDFLEPADAFLERYERVQRLDGPAFDTAKLPAPDGGPVVVVPAAPVA